VSPLVRFRQAPAQTSEQLTQTPFLQLGVAPPHVPHSSVPPQPSAAVPQWRPRSAQVFGIQTHCRFWQTSCSPQQIAPQQTPSQHWLSWQQGLPAEPQPLLHPPSSSLQTVAGGPQQERPQLSVAGSPQQVPPAQPLAGEVQVAPSQVSTRSVQT
jgi:hypothetical protein